MIIYGTRNRERDIGSGQFYCPKCDEERPYVHKRIARYFTLFFIPLFKLSTLGEHVECQVCRRAYKPEILTTPPLPPAERLKAAAVVKTELEAGGSLDAAREKLAAEGVDEKTARRIVEIVAGDKRKTCRECGLWYHNSATACSKCGGPLEESTVAQPPPVAVEKTKTPEQRRRSGCIATATGSILTAIGGIILLIVVMAQLSSEGGPTDNLTGFIGVLILCPVPLLVVGLILFGIGIYSFRRAKKAGETDQESD